MKHSSIEEKAIWETIEPFLYGRSSRQRLVLYLVAAGYKFEELMLMSVDMLRRIELPEQVMEWVGDVTCELQKNDSAFQFPNGKHLARSDFVRMIKHVSKRDLKKEMALDSFAAMLSKSMQRKSKQIRRELEQLLHK